jgi:hypothetical protein
MRALAGADVERNTTMAEFSAYAEVLTPDHHQYKAYAAGIKKNPPGRLLQDVLDETGGEYAYEMYLADQLRENIRAVARLNSDSELAHIATLAKVPISLEHLRHVDPRTTRIVLGHRFSVTEAESRSLGLGHEGPFDPRNTIIIDR